MLQNGYAELVLANVGFYAAALGMIVASPLLLIGSPLWLYFLAVLIAGGTLPILGVKVWYAVDHYKTARASKPQLVDRETVSMLCQRPITMPGPHAT